jgi:hypothetical protein
MQSRLSMRVAIVTMAVLAGSAHLAVAWEPGRLTALTARQDLRDQVCIAMSDGQISRGERYTILTNAKAILKPEEYEGLKRSMDRLSPPQASPAIKSVAARPSSKVAAVQRSASAMPTKATRSAEVQALLPTTVFQQPTIPASAILPDRMGATADSL